MTYCVNENDNPGNNRWFFLNGEDKKRAEHRIKLKKLLLKNLRSYIQYRRLVLENMSDVYKNCKPYGISFFDKDIQKFIDSNLPAKKLLEYQIQKLEQTTSHPHKGE